jgi:nucleotide-binding universal stress UspA family protein
MENWIMRKAKRILVGLKTFDHAVELTNLACRVGAPNALLMLAHVIELPEPTPLDADVPEIEAEAKRIFRAAERVAKRTRMKVSKQIFRAHNAGEALLEEMKQKKTDLAVLGYHHRRTIGELLLGTTAQHISRHAPCHLLLSIPLRE